eukprot:CAMPEP_0181334462 /NCGR_PEP_ID=MMETSP1101-20121128/26271_1 /TAXON_ID=46948 /ORGANISM="Rhodomonas abbreviata, Strain Caron Lab Isolate" /LENGTH=183 /DNA_ID=CAMNT_0023444437 /DNA_START=33 /DNA_END=584 /DNA_ORIENTATION=+
MASDSQPTIEQALQVPRAQEQATLEAVRELDVRHVFWACLERAYIEKVNFGGVGANLLLRHFDWFWKANAPTIHVDGLTKFIIVDEYLRALVPHHFRRMFVTEMRVVLRKVEKEMTASSAAISLGPIKQTVNPRFWERVVTWRKIAPSGSTPEKMAGKQKAASPPSGAPAAQRARTQSARIQS